MVNENLVDNIVSEPYKYGFVTEIESEKISKGSISPKDKHEMEQAMIRIQKRGIKSM